MIDWSEASTVALSGIISVFLVLAVLQISVQGICRAVNSLDKKKQ